MNHDNIEEQHIIDRYLMGKLPEDEAARFEEHYLHCQECQAALRLGQHMQRGFKVAATEELLAAKAVQRAAFMAWLWRRQGVLGAVLMLVLMAVPTTLMWKRSSDLERQLQSTQANLASVDAARRDALLPASGPETTVQPTATPATATSPDATPGAATPNDQLPTEDLAAQLASQRSDFERRLEEAQQRNATLDAALDAARQPSGNTRLLYLGAERSALAAAPSHRLALPQPAAWIVLALEVDAGGFDSYRAVLYDAEGAIVWQGDSLHLDIQDTVNVSIHSSSLRSGDYRLELEGVSGDHVEAKNKVEAVGTFALRVD